MKTDVVIGVIGNGFVGGAVAHGHKMHGHKVLVYDVLPDRSPNTIEEIWGDSDFVYVCVPTPPTEDGWCDLNYVEQVFHVAQETPRKPCQTIILKSTVTPGTTKWLENEFGERIVFCPEFLTAVRAKEDFVRTKNLVIGAHDHEYAKEFKNICLQMFTGCMLTLTDPTTAEMVKYMLNCFLATKVSFLNEMKQIIDQAGGNWNESASAFIKDERIGTTHCMVPGPDGQLGFGGACFPKDIQALIAFAKFVNVKPSVIEAAWEKNKEVRPDES